MRVDLLLGHHVGRALSLDLREPLVVRLLERLEGAEEIVERVLQIRLATRLRLQAQFSAAHHRGRPDELPFVFSLFSRNH